MRTSKKVVEETKKEEKKQELKEAFALWKNEGKNGKMYLTGKVKEDETKLIAFMNTDKKNEKQPDLIVYVKPDEKTNLTKDDKIASLWIQTSKNKKDYFTGLTNDNEKLVGFISDGKNEKAPYISVYFKEKEV